MPYPVIGFFSQVVANQVITMATMGYRYTQGSHKHDKEKDERVVVWFHIGLGGVQWKGN